MKNQNSSLKMASLKLIRSLSMEDGLKLSISVFLKVFAYIIKIGD